MVGWKIVTAPRATTVSRDSSEVYAFDLEGRPISWWDGKRTFKRSLASDVHVRERPDGTKTYSVLSGDEAEAAFAALLDRVGRAVAEDAGPRARIERILSWTPGSLLAERARFERAYEPISILPPDQYLSIVVQATFGCSWNRCTFCDFFQGRPFKARSPDAVENHLDAVEALFGRAAALRRSIFLADGNALLLSEERLKPTLDRVRARFPGRPVAGFVDVYTAERKPPEAWRRLGEAGLETVHIGIESGHDPLLRWMDKPASADETVDLARTLKAAGLRVAAIFLAGAGGDRFAGAHLDDTIALLGRLPLGRGDIVYLSPFVEHDGSEYARRASIDGVRPLHARAIEVQLDLMRAAVRRLHPEVRAARYDLREFIY